MPSSCKTDCGPFGDPYAYHDQPGGEWCNREARHKGLHIGYNAEAGALVVWLPGRGRWSREAEYQQVVDVLKGVEVADGD